MQASYDDRDALRSIVDSEKPDWLYHVAGVTKGVGYEDFWRGNVMPTANLLWALREAHPDVKRFVHVSSLAAFGPSTAHRPLREDDPRRPVEHYGRSKLEAEQVVEDEPVVPWTIVRPAAVYGPGDVDYFELFKITRRRLNLFYGNRDKPKSVIYVDDCVDAIVRAASADAAIGQGYFLCDGEPLTWERFQELLVEHLGKRVVTVNLPGALLRVVGEAGELASKVDGKARLFNKQKAIMGLQDAWTCSGDKAAKEIGFEAKIKPREGVRLTDEWYEREGWY